MEVGLPFHGKVHSLLRKLRKITHKTVHCMASVQSGYFPVYVGEERKRDVIPVECLSSIMMRALLNQFEDEVHRAGHAITLPCSAEMFEVVLDLSQKKEDVMDSRTIEGRKEKKREYCLVLRNSRTLGRKTEKLLKKTATPGI